MTDAFAILDEVAAWISDHRKILESRGRVINVESNGDRLKKSLAISIDYGNLLSQLIVWDNGDAQLMRADTLQDIDRDEYRRISSRADLVRVLDDLVAWTSGGR